MGDKFWKAITIFFVLAVGVAILTHAYGFSLAAGTLFQGFNTLGQTLEGGSIASGGTRVRLCILRQELVKWRR